MVLKPDRIWNLVRFRLSYQSIRISTLDLHKKYKIEFPKRGCLMRGRKSPHAGQPRSTDDYIPIQWLEMCEICK
jgi:hypothetical protein